MFNVFILQLFYLLLHQLDLALQSPVSAKLAAISRLFIVHSTSHSCYHPHLETLYRIFTGVATKNGFFLLDSRKTATSNT
jgi:hypothetical protein